MVCLLLEEGVTLCNYPSRGVSPLNCVTVSVLGTPLRHHTKIEKRNIGGHFDLNFTTYGQFATLVLQQETLNFLFL